MIEMPVGVRRFAMREVLHKEQMIQKYGARYVGYQNSFALIEMSKEARVPVLKFEGGAKEPTVREILDCAGELAPLGIGSQKELWAKDRFLLHPSDYVMLQSYIQDEQFIEEGNPMDPFVTKIQENIFYWEDIDALLDMDQEGPAAFLIFVNGEYSTSPGEELWQRLEADHREICDDGWLIDYEPRRRGKVAKFFGRLRDMVS